MGEILFFFFSIKKWKKKFSWKKQQEEQNENKFELQEWDTRKNVFTSKLDSSSLSCYFLESSIFIT